MTSLSYFWKALWAFVLGYVVSSMIQVFVTRESMQKSMGEAGRGSIALGTFFGFISSSCSFAALSTTKSLFKKGAGFVPALAFLLASTNLVIELYSRRLIFGLS
ncbi:MAG: permease [Phormidesmis sp.]